MKQFISRYIFLSLFLFAIFGCQKENKYLFRDSGTWEIESMQVDFINASGATDSTVSSNISGFFMFYDTPTTGSDPFYLCTNGLTINGHEQHTAHFWKSHDNTIVMITTVGQLTNDRSYTISDHKKNEMTLDYSGPANGMYFNYNSYTGNLKEHIVLKRIKF